MPDEPQEQFHLPHYPSTTHVHIATRDQQKPMLKMLGRMVKMMKRPGKVGKTPSRPHSPGKKGLQARQTIAIKHKKIFY